MGFRGVVGTLGTHELKAAESLDPLVLFGRQRARWHVFGHGEGEQVKLIRNWDAMTLALCDDKTYTSSSYPGVPFPAGFCSSRPAKLRYGIDRDASYAPAAIFSSKDDQGPGTLVFCRSLLKDKSFFGRGYTKRKGPETPIVSKGAETASC
jgi:hypothetical protein